MYEHIGKEDSQTQRKSAFLESAQLLGELVSADLKTIAFCSVRKICELVLKYCHELMDQDVDKYKLKDLVKSYRGGYHKKERREIEQSLFQGNLRGVVSTCNSFFILQISNLKTLIISYKFATIRFSVKNINHLHNSRCEIRYFF